MEMAIRRGTLGAAALVLAAAVPAATPARAQAPQAGAVELFGFGQYAKYDDKNNLGSHAGGGGGLGLYVMRWLSVEADASYASIGVAGGNHVSHIPLRLRGVLNYSMGESSVFAGVGGVRTQFGSAMDTHYWGVSTVAGARVGLGMRGLALRIDGTGDFHPEPKYAVLGARAGLSMRFGGETTTTPAPKPEPVLADRSDSDGDGVNDVRDRCPGTQRGVQVGESGCPTMASTGLVDPSLAPQAPRTQTTLPVVVAPRRDSTAMADPMTATTSATADSATRAAQLRDSVTRSVISRDSAERLELRRMLEMRQATIRDSLARIEQARRDSMAAVPAAPALTMPTTPAMTAPAMTTPTAPARVDSASMPTRAPTTTPARTDSAAMTQSAPARTTAATAPAPAAVSPAPAANAAPSPFGAGSATVLENVSFTLAAASLEQSSYAELDRIAEWLLQNPSVRVEVGGYTDASGRRESQMQLSQARAQAVRDYLVQQGVPAARVTAKGYGPANPRAGNSTPEERAKNRRIELRKM